MKNKILTLAIVMAVLCVPKASADSGQLIAPAQTQSPTTYTLSLEQAVEMAKKSSPALECCDVNKENLRVQRKNASIAKKNMKNVEIKASTGYDAVFVKQGYYVEMYDRQYELADYEKAKTESSISYEVTQKYYNCKNAIAMYDSARSALERATENESLTKMRLSLGMCTQLDADSVSLSVAQCRANLEKCKSNIEIAEEALKIALGIEGNCVINLTDALTPEPFSANLEEDTSKALISRYDVNALKTASELAQSYFKIVSSLNHENATYYSAYTNRIKSDFDYSTGVKNITLAIKSSYHSAVDAVNQSELAAKRLEIMKKEYETFRIKNEIGMITTLTLSLKADELTECENAYNNALLARKLAIEKYRYDVTTGV